MLQLFTRRLLVLLLISAVLGALAVWRRSPARAVASVPDPGPQLRAAGLQVQAIERQEAQIATTVWAKELQAEECGRVLEALWDRLNRATNKWAELAAFPVQKVILPDLDATPDHGLGVEIFTASGRSQILDASSWKHFLIRCEQNGWQLKQMELRHVQFDAAEAGKPRHSQFYGAAHLDNARLHQRMIVDGILQVEWQPASASSASPVVNQVDSRQLSVRTRLGDPGFKEVLVETISPAEQSFFIDPLIVADLDGDGLPEVILAAKNLVYHRKADGSFEARSLCRFPPGLILTAVLADFDGDGLVDFLCAKFDGLYLFKGSAQGTFDNPGELVWSARPHLKYAQALTCGDVDGDGNVDVWLGQYKLPYDRGQMPTPFYEANDGYPSYLLRNDGHGHFSDVTVAAGLGPKRWRRVYSASLVDFNGDGKLDLVTASDFAGLELFANDGHGQFTDVTARLRPDWHGFGMSQLAADLNQDGRLDLLMVGMNVPVVSRLQHFGCVRPGFESYLAASEAAAAGNRLFLGEPTGSFAQADFGRALAKTGWSWGCAALDFDNDGFPDLYIANGHESKESVRDYETEFWLHDIYVGNSRDDLATFAYFQAKHARTRGQGMSYGGYEKNRLLWNRQGQSFVEIGFLMGVALEQDSRNVVAADLDGDGRVDLLTTTFEAWPETKQTLRIYRNELPETGNWIGFRFRSMPGEPSPIGAQVHLYWDGKNSVQQVVAGDSYRSQRSETLHFGIGPSQTIERAEIRWANGAAQVLLHPAINQYFSMHPPPIHGATAP